MQKVDVEMGMARRENRVHTFQKICLRRRMPWETLTQMMQHLIKNASRWWRRDEMSISTELRAPFGWYSIASFILPTCPSATIFLQSASSGYCQRATEKGLNGLMKQKGSPDASKILLVRKPMTFDLYSKAWLDQAESGGCVFFLGQKNMLVHRKPRWWFQRFCIFTSYLGKWSNLTSIFFNWVGSTTN